MIVFFILDESGEYASVDGCKRYTRLTGRKLFEYLNTPEGKEKIFDIEVDDNGNKVGVEVPIEMQKKYRSIKRRKDFVEERKERANITEISFESEYMKDDDNLGYDETFEDRSTEDIFEILTREEEKNKLKEALNTLTEEEYAIIYNLFLAEKPISERAYAKVTQIPRKTLEYRKMMILKKIKNFF